MSSLHLTSTRTNPQPRTLSHRVLVLVAFVVAFGAPALSPAAGLTKGELNTALRKLWEEHVTWTRSFVVSATSGLPDQEATANRLLKNQSDIGNAVKPFYGDAAGDKLTALLKDHILIAAGLITAAKAGDSAKLEEFKKRWYANGDDIAAFLSGANPSQWPLDAVKGMMREHLDLTTQSVVARLQGDWKSDIAAYDKIHEHILTLSDTLAKGIFAQFPDKFVWATSN